MYCLNHFINSDKRIDFNGRLGIRALNVHLWNFDFEAALDCLSRTSPDHPDAIDTELLIKVIRIYQNISFIASKDEELSRKFYKRKSAEFPMPREGRNDDISIPYTLLSEEISQVDLATIFNLSLASKLFLLKKSLNWAIQLAKEMVEISKIEIEKKNNCYIPYLFLSNDVEASNHALIL
jgi:hypothetical protein